MVSAVVQLTSVACPLQLEATIDGTEYFYRARHQHWRLEENSCTIANGDCSIAQETSLDFGVGKLLEVLVLHLQNEANQAFEERMKDNDG